MSRIAGLGEGLPGPEQLQALMRGEPMAGIGRMTGSTLTEVREGLAAFEAPPDENVYDPVGTAHAGHAATLLDAEGRLHAPATSTLLVCST